MRLFTAGVPNVAGGSTFDPLSISWAHAYWASDPDWTDPGDGNGVSSWRDAGSGANNLAQGTGGNRPLFRAAYTGLSNQPAIEFVSTDSLITTGAASLAQPNHIYIVGFQSASGGTTQAIIDAPTTAGTVRHILNARRTSTLGMYAGTMTTPGTSVTGAFQMAGYFNTTASALRCNGQNITGLSIGTHSFQNIRLGLSGASAEPFLGALAFVGVNDTALTADELTDLSAWAASTYGVPSL